MTRGNQHPKSEIRNPKWVSRARPFSPRTSGLGLCLLAATLLFAAFTGSSAFVYESATEFFTAADFNGDGVADVLVLDKLTGNARVGYAGTNGALTWSSPLVTGVENATGCAAGHFRFTTRDVLAVTTANLNRVNLIDLLNTNSAVLFGSSTAGGLGPHSLASLSAVLGFPLPQGDALLIASSLNDAPAERLDVVTDFSIGANSSAGQVAETGSFERANALSFTTGGQTFAVGLVRGTNDALHVWQAASTPSVILSLSNLPHGSDYVFGNFNAESLPRFIFYQPGSSNLSIYPVISTNGGFAFGAATSVTASEPVQQVFYLQLGTDGSAVLRFGDGVQGMRLPGGVPTFSSTYRSGGGAAGNGFTGIAPLANGQFVLFDAPTGSLASVHEQVVRFDGTNFTQLTSSNLPPLTARSTRANAWLFQLEPFVNRDAGFIASVNASDWSDSISGLPGALNVVRESDAGTNSGLGSATTSNLGAPPTGSTNGLPNQYNPAISVFTYSAPRAAETVFILIAPPPGPYAGPITISLSWPGNGRQAYYRTSTSDPWHSYSAPFLLTNDATIQYYGSTIVNPTRSQVQFASYTLGVSGAAPPSPVNPNPGNTNPPPVLATNAVVLSQNGTVFYGRVSAANNYTIWAINLDGSGDTCITTGARPRVSRDGRNVAFLRGGSPLVTQGNVWVRNLQTGQETVLYTNSNYTLGYDWDLTGTNLVFDWSCWLWRMSLGGTAAVLPLPAPDCYDDAPVVNPVDGRLAFHNLNANAAISGLYVTTPVLTSKQRLNPGVAASWPAWSPDGQWLVFADGNSSASSFTADNGTNLWVMRSDGTSLNQITGFSDGANRFPHGAIWGPDGDDLVGAGTIFGTNGLWIIPLTPALDDCDGPPFRLPTTPGDAIDFAGSIVVAASPSSLVTTTQAPGLFIRQTPDAVVVYWSTNFVGFALESETNLLSRAWTPINGPYFLSGPYFEHWEARGSLSSQKYSRLHSPAVFVLSQPPVLTIQLQTNNAVLSWSALPAGFTLQSKTDLSSAVPWNDLIGPYSINGGNFEYREPSASTQHRFFRLRGP
jgi:hypothetical protein